MDISFRYAARAALEAQTSEIQSNLIKQLSWLANHQGPAFLDYRVTPYVMEPQAGYIFRDETCWVIYVLTDRELQVINLGDDSSNPRV